MRTTSKIIVFLIFTFGCEELLSQDVLDSIISVRLRQNPQKECYLDLVFENRSEDTVFLLSEFENFYLKRSHAPGIQINGYVDRKIGRLNWGELPKKRFIFSDGLSKIAPQSSIFFEFDLRMFCYKPKDDHEFGIDFDINFIYYTLQEDSNNIKRSGDVRMKTNYVKFERKN
ncbi:MAG: hypothetical protein LBF01_00820 [Bacteroidales bacterium]|jgi:hypothetical protein|nr:hypothetical protein [Bacteroidales bacterium]